VSQTGWILDIDRFASHDGPGIRATIFLKGCPLSCLWCHSPESQVPGRELLYRADRCTACWLCLETCPTKALSKGERSVVLDRSLCDGCGECCEVCYPGALEIAGKKMSVDEIVDRVGRDAAFFKNSGGGVTLSGGEPLSQPEFSYQLLSGFKDRGIHTAVETTGITTWEALSQVSKVTDLFLFDFKIFDDDLHRRFIGSSNKLILRNLEHLCSERDRIQVRVPCIPGINDSEDQIRALATAVAAAGARTIALLPYNSAASAKYAWIDRPFELDGRKRQDQNQMEILADICRGAGLETEIVG
jgi:pyruvate formate lyase activating enzyme